MSKEEKFSRNNCLLCGEELQYFSEPKILECSICHQKSEAEVSCINGHFICDECHSKKGIELIEEVCAHTESKNPIEIMQRIMKQPYIYMHGPEHHVLVGAALLAAYDNSGGSIDRKTALKEMVRRGRQVPGGVCGFWGSCGAGISTGIFLGIITGANPLKEEEWGLSNLMTAASLKAIGEIGGPRCCKRDSFLAVREAVVFVKEHFGISMELPPVIQCEFSVMNEQCIEKRCPWNKNL